MLHLETPNLVGRWGPRSSRSCANFMPISHYLVVVVVFFFWGGGVGRPKIPRAGYADRVQFLANNFLQNKDNAKLKPPSRSARQCTSNDVHNCYVK